MSLTFKELGQVMVESNTGAAKQAAKRRTGNMINERVINLIQPKLPLMVRGYADSELGKAVICNAIAAGLIKYFPTNEKVLLASDAMITAAMDNFIGSFNIEQMIDEVLDGINLEPLKETTEDVRETTGSVLRKAADIVEPANGTTGGVK